jgi:galactan 5-O-arabinofuranosyltransferase
MTLETQDPTDAQPRPQPAPGPGHAAEVTDRTLPGVLGELAVAIVVAAVVSAPVQLVLGHFWVPQATYAPAALATLCDVVLLVAVIGLLARPRWPRWGSAASAAVLSLVSTVSLATMLMGTRYYLGGIIVDQQFRVEYLTRFTDSASLADFAYQGAPAYYSPGWFWLGGRFANLFHLAGWEAYKPWSITTVAVTGAVGFVLWSLVAQRRRALLLSLLTTVIGLLVGAAEPYSWFVTATVAPLLVLGWRLLTALRTAPPGEQVRTLTPVVVLGMSLGVYGLCYTLLWAFALFLLGLATLVTIGWAVSDHRRGAGPPVRPLLIALVPRVLGVGAINLALMLLTWTPFLLAKLQGRASTNVAAHYLPPNSAALPTPMLDISVTGALCLLGAGWLLVRLRHQPVAQALAIGVAGGYVWFLLSNLLVAVGTTLLSWRVIPPMTVLLACAAVFAAQDAYRWARRNAARLAGVSVRLAAVVFGLVTLIALLEQAPAANQSDLNLAFTNYYPTGYTPGRTRDPHDPDAWLPELADTVSQFSGGKPADQLTVLTDDWTLMSVQPYWSFQASTPHYANPMADFDARRFEVARWAAAASPAQLISELDHGAFPAPRVFVLRQDRDGGLHISLSRDVFPKQPNVGYYDVTFRAALFQDPAFVSRVVGPYTVVVRR